MADKLVWFINGKPVCKDVQLIPNDVRMHLILSREATAGKGSKGFNTGNGEDYGLWGASVGSEAQRRKINNDVTHIRSVRVWSVTPNSSSSGKPAIPVNVRKSQDNAGTYLAWDPVCLLYTSPSPRDKRQSRMPSSA